MSRVANKPVPIPKGVEINLNGQLVSVKGSKGVMQLDLHPTVGLEQNEGELKVIAGDDSGRAMAGTMRALLNNVVIGVSQGFEKKLTLIGVGYRAQAQGNKLNLTLGFSHPVEYDIPEGIKIETPSQTEIVVTGIDKQKVGQVASDIRAYRPPEPYKGKGVRYTDEHVVRKEAKKK
ncbi:MAG: 50S ribosomal protein L6 [Gammaproteobacteria bacterium]|nr:50S ribosomal protein L6 [Gammaproteobacteria bacterium]